MALGDLVAKRGPAPKERLDPGPNYRKRCNVCKRKRMAKFFHNRSASFDGLSFTCKDCARTRHQARYTDADARRDAQHRAREWQRGNPDRRRMIIRKHNLKRNYGITPEHFESMLRKQRGLCAICSTRMEKPFVDHDHVTGRVRSLLCITCNLALGALKDDPALAIAAARYLRRWSKSHSETL